MEDNNKTTTNERRKWLYDTFVSEGINVGKDYDEFDSLIANNEESRKWLYNEACSLGYNVGKDYDEFNSLIGNIESPSADPVAQVKDNSLVNETESTPSQQKKTESITHDPSFSQQAMENNEPEYVKGFGQGFKQGWKGLVRGTHYLIGETANLFTGSTIDEEKALARIAEFENNGIDIESSIAPLDKVQKQVYETMLSNGETQLSGVTDEDKRHARMALEDDAINKTIRKYIEKAGSLEEAKIMLAERAKEETWGDRQMKIASQKLSELKATKGFGAWVGNLVPQMIPTAVSIGVGAITKNPKLTKGVGAIGMGAMTASTAGMSMNEARESGATGLQTWAVGIADGSIEFLTEKIPFNRYTSRVLSSVKKDVGNELAEAVANSPQARNELERLLQEANKKLGGKLFNGKNVKDFAGDIVAEGLSEFTAEALQTITPMIYENPEDYPTIGEILKNGWEGAKAGVFMGSVLGGASKTMEHYQQKNRRKEQGFVDVVEFETEDGNEEIGEAVGFDNEGSVAVLTDGKIQYVIPENIIYSHRFSFEEFDTAELQMESDESYDNGYSMQDPQEMNDANNNYQYHRQNLAQMFGIDESDIESFLGEDPIATAVRRRQNGESEEGTQAIIDYLNAKATYDGMLQGVRDDIDGQIEQSNALIDSYINKGTGMVHGAVLKEGEQLVYIVNGNAVAFDDGVIDNQNSSQTIIVKDAATGELHQISPTDIASLYDVQDPNEQKEMNAQRIRDGVADEALNKINGVVLFNSGDIHTIINEDGSQTQVTVTANEQGFIENPDGTINVTDGNKTFTVPKDVFQQQTDAANMERVAAINEHIDEVRKNINNPSSTEEKDVSLQTQEQQDEVSQRISQNNNGTQASQNGRMEEAAARLRSSSEAFIRTGGRSQSEISESEVKEIREKSSYLWKYVSFFNYKYGYNFVSEDSFYNWITKKFKTSKEIRRWLSNNIPQSDIDDAMRAIIDYGIAVKQLSVSSLIPKDESDNPIYEQADPATAWDALMEEAEGDEEIAMSVAQSMIADKEKELSRLEKTKVKEGSTVAEKTAAHKAHKAAIEQARQNVDAWRSIAGIPTMRQQAELEERQRIEDERAAQQKAEEERIKAEQEEAARLENERLNGIPDYTEDTPQNARTRGYRRVNGHFEQRQQPLQAVQGKETEVEFSNEVRPKGYYAVIDASQLQPSHIQGNRNPMHFLDEAQPKERNDNASIMSAQKIAGNIRPATITTGETAYVGTPTVNARGEVIQGNSRSDALKLMYGNHKNQGQIYKQYLIDNAEQFGLNPEDVANMENPVLVRMLDVSDEQAITLGQYVAQDTESGGVERIKPKNAVKKMGDDMRTFASILLDSADEDLSFAELLDSNGVKVLKWMNQKGYITDTQYSSAFDSRGNLTGDIKNDLRGIMYQSIFQGGSTRLEEMFNALPAKAQKAILATAHRDFSSPSSESMIKEIQSSIYAFYALMQDEQFAKAKDYKSACKAAEAWQKQYQMDDITGESYLPSEKFSNFALLLAQMYKGKRQSDIQGVFEELYDLIQGTKEDNLFEQADNTPRTLVQAIKETLNIDYNGQRRNNVLVGDNKTSQQGQRRSDRDSSDTERTESSERTDDDSGRTGGDSGRSENKGHLAEWQGGLGTSVEISDNEFDEDGLPFVMSSTGTTVFGEIKEETGLTPAPIKLSLGNSKYGLVHLEKRHGKQIIDAGFNSVEEFVEYVCKNYRRIGKGENSVGEENGTYLLQIEDNHNNTLYVELSTDGSYWGVNSGGVFRKGYGNNKKEVWSASEVQNKQSATDSTLRDEDKSDNPTTPNGNVPSTSDDKDTTNSPKVKGLEEENSQSLGEQIKDAEKEVNTSPTDKQKEAGNYKKGHVQIGTFNITIEQPKGSVRSGVDANGRKWETTMHNTYGYIRGTEGVDGDHIDVFLSDDIDGWNGSKVFVVDQYNEDGTFDEHKVMLGFNTIEEAESAYLDNYEKGWEKKHKIVVSPIHTEEFEKWIDSSHRKTKPFAEYKSVKSAENRTKDNENRTSQEHSNNDILESVTEEITDIINDSKVEGVNVKEIWINENSTDSQLDAVLFYEGNVSEDDLSNLINEYGLIIEGTRINTIPIQVNSQDDIDRYKNRSNQSDGEKVSDKQKSESKQDSKSEKTDSNTIVEQSKKPSSKIEDFGEKIGGARKDVIRKYADKINVNGTTFKTMFPKPDIDKLIEAGLPVNKVAAVKAMFDNAKREFESKKKHYGKDKALQNAAFYAMYAQNVLTGNENNFDLSFNGFVFTEWGKAFMKANIALYQSVFDRLGVEYGKMDLSSYGINPITEENKKKYNLKHLNEQNRKSQEEFAKRKGTEPPVYKDGDLINFVGSQYYNPKDQFETLEEAIDTMVERIEKEVKVGEESKHKAEIYWKKDALGRTDYSKIFVGVKVHGYGTVDLMEFKSSNEAYNWVKEHETDFQQMASAKTEQLKSDKSKPLPKYRIDNRYVRNDNGSIVRYEVFADFGKGITHTLKTFEIPAKESSQDRLRAQGEVYKNEVLPYMNSDDAKQSADEHARRIQREKESKNRNYTTERKSRERVGKDWRNGKDATPDMFVDMDGKKSVFGFRAVEFGNYVTNKERQQFLNDIYDALMDMSDVLGVSPRALSLGGQLAIAVGARGKSSASGHYEPEKNVINLTKTSGYGVLAHEWMHAFDRYFSNYDPSAIYVGGVRYATGTEYKDDTRQEVKDAFAALMDVMKKSDYYKRSMMLGEYWASDKELAARALQDHIIRKLNERGQKNDFLSNLTATEDWDGNANDYPFPIGEESERIGEAIDNLFSVIEEKVDEKGNAVMYQKGELVMNAESEAFRRATERTMKQLESIGIEVEIVEDETIVDNTAEKQVIENYNEKFNRELQQQINGTLPKGHIYQLGMASAKLQSAGIPYLPIELAASRLSDKSMQENHPFELSEIEGLVEAVQNPLAVFRSATRIGSFVVLTEIQHEGKNYVAAIQVNRKMGKVEVNTIRSIYPKDGAQIANWIEEGLSEYVDKEKMSEWISKQRSNSADVRNLFRRAAKIIQKFENRAIRSSFSRSAGIFYSNAKKPMFMRTSSGTIYGWTVNGKIYLTKDGINPNTPVHEYAHLWAESMANSNPKRWKRIIEGLKDSPVWNEVLIDSEYKDIHGNDNLMASEVLSRLSGNENYKRTMEDAQREIESEKDIFAKAEKITIWERVKQALKDFWNWVGLRFTRRPIAPEQSTEMVLADFWNGIRPEAENGPMQRMFVGEKGAANIDKAKEATSRLDNLSVARNMETEGKDAKNIKLATGWERGSDGKWRYEMMDDFRFDRSGNVDFEKRNPEYRRYKELVHKNNALAFEGKKLSAEEKSELDKLSAVWKGEKLHNSRRLKDYIDAPELFDAYPELKGVEIRFEVLEDGVQGKYNHKQNTITLNAMLGKEDAVSTLNHEIQHAIQHIEGFAKGGSSNDVITRKQEFKSEVRKLHEMMLETPEWAEYVRLVDRWINNEDASVEARIDKISASGVLDGIRSEQDRLRRKYGSNTIVGRILNGPYAEDADIWNELPDSFNDRFDAYRRLAGEVESRNVQRRMEMSAEERRNSLAQETEDVAREDQVFLYDALENAEEYNVLYRDEEYKTEKIFGGIWIEDKQEFAKFVSAVNNNYVFEEDGEGITYTDNHFYAYYWNIDGEPTPYIDVYLNAEESQDVVNEVSKEINHVRRGKGIKKYIDRAITRAGSSNGKNNGNHGNNTSIPHRAGNDKLGGNILRKGRYFDNPSLYVKTQRADRYNREVINSTVSSSPAPAHRRQMVEHAENLAKRLHLDNIEIVNSVSGLEGKKKSAKGFYDPKTGKITIVIPNNTSIADIEKTLLHEAVAHYGLRQLFGEHFDTFLDNVYNNVDESIRKRIAELAIRKYNYDFRKATEEYLASLAESTNFENAQQSGWWQKVKDFFFDMLGKLGFKGTLTDNELRYVLWRSYENLKEKKNDNIFSLASDIAKQHELGVGNYAKASQSDDDILFRDGDNTYQDKATVRKIYENRMNNGLYQSAEAMLDSTKSLEEAMLMIDGKAKHVEDIADHENAYLGENRLSSVNSDEITVFEKAFVRPMLKAAAKLAKKKQEFIELIDYMMAKHGLERNEYMRQQAMQNGEKADRDFAGLTALTGKKDVAAAEAEAKRMVDEYEQNHDTAELWDKVNAVSKAILKKSYDSGLMNKETFDRISSMYKFYIPLRGFDEKTSAEAYAYLTHKESAFNAPIKQAYGRTSKADNPLVYLQSMAESTIMQGNRNRLVKQRFLNFILNHPSDLVSVSELWLKKDDATGEWKQVFPIDVNINIDNADSGDIVEQKMKDFEELMEALAKQHPDKYKKSSDAKDIPYKVVTSKDMHEHQIVVKRDGRDVILTVNGNPRLAHAINGLTNPDNNVKGTLHYALEMVGSVNRFKSALYTTWSVGFLAGNFMRDCIYSNSMVWVKEDLKGKNKYYALKYNYNYLKLFGRMKRLLRKYNNGTLDMNDPTHKHFYDFMRNGGETGYRQMNDIGVLREKTEQFIKAANSLGALNGKGRDIAEWLGEVGRGIENHARFAAFITSRDMGRDMGRSIYDAKDISVNFNKKGSGDKYLGETGQTPLGNVSAATSFLGRTFFYFWNAALQGTFGNFFKHAVRHPYKALTVSSIWFTLGLLVTALASSDDDDDDESANYFNNSEHTRRSNVMIKSGKNFLKVPLPIEYRAIYGLGELCGSTIFNNEELTVHKIMSLTSQLMPVDFMAGQVEGDFNLIQAFIPSSMKTHFELKNNRSWTGMPIYKDTPFNQDKPDWTKAYSGTNKNIVNITKNLNEKTGGDAHTKGIIDMNPAKVEYWLQGNLGGIWTLTDQLIKTGGWILGERDFRWNYIPVAERFVTTPDERNAYRHVNNEYFRLKKEHDQLHTRIKAYEKDTYNGIFDYAEKIDFLYNSPEYQRYEIFEKYKDVIKMADELVKQAAAENDEEALKDAQMYLNETRKKMVTEVKEMNKTRQTRKGA